MGGVAKKEIDVYRWKSIHVYSCLAMPIIRRLEPVRSAVIWVGVTCFWSKIFALRCGTLNLIPR